MNYKYTGNNDIPQNRRLFVKEQNKKIDSLDRLYDQCMDMRFKSPGTKITIPMNLFRRFTDIILDQKRSLVYEIGEKLEYDSLLVQNSELKQKITENEINNIVDEEYQDDDEDVVLKEEIDIDDEPLVENFTELDDRKYTVDQYFSNSNLSPFNYDPNNCMCQANLDSAFNVKGDWKPSDFKFGREDFTLLSDKKVNAVEFPLGTRESIDNDLDANYLKI